MQSMNFHLGMRMPPGRRFAVSSAVRSADLQHLNEGEREEKRAHNKMILKNCD